MSTPDQLPLKVHLPGVDYCRGFYRRRQARSLRFARTLSNLLPERRNTQVKTGAKEGVGRSVLRRVSVVLNLPFGAFEMLTTYQWRRGVFCQA